MKNILLERGQSVLDQVAREKMLLVFDFDGTLASIVNDREAAQMRPTTRLLLRVAALLYPCAVLSGRTRADLMKRVDRVGLMAVVGNHGAEAGFGPVPRALRDVVLRWKRALGPALRDLAGVEIEDKGLSIAVHYRGASSRSAARRVIRELAAELPDARLFAGRAVLNLLPAGSHHKGDAVTKLLARTGCRHALYVGDDVTDEDAFRCADVAIGVRVGRTHMSAARYYVPSQAAVDDLLRGLIRARRRRDGLDEDVEGLEKLMAKEA